MTAILITTVIFLTLILGLNCIPLLIKTDFPKSKKVIVRMLVISTIFFLTFLVLEFYGYRLKGIYSFPAIGLTFIVLTLTYFGLFKNTHKKVFSIFLLAPLIIVCIITHLFGKTLKEFDINHNTKIMVRNGGPLSCGEVIYITQTKFGLFDKEVHYESSLCLHEITQIKTFKIDDRKIEFLIYHNAEQDTENPYQYEVERKNGW